MCHASIKQTAIYADLAPEHLADSVEVLTATEKRTAIKTASGVSELLLTA
jgi:hypothetical protein